MASYMTQYPGNTAIQQEVWTLTIAEAKAAIPALITAPGSYWEQVLLKPTRRAIRAHAATVTVYTAGFSTSELSNALWASGSTVRGTN